MAEPADDIGMIGCPSTVRPTDDIELRRLRADRYLRGKDVLDIGTGTGRLALLAARIARSVVGQDPDPEGIREAKREARRRGLGNARFRVSAAQDLRLGREVFDTAIFSWSL